MTAWGCFLWALLFVIIWPIGMFVFGVLQGAAQEAGDVVGDVLHEKKRRKNAAEQEANQGGVSDK